MTAQLLSSRKLPCYKMGVTSMPLVCSDITYSCTAVLNSNVYTYSSVALLEHTVCSRLQQ